MAKYLGSEIIDPAQTKEFKNHTQHDWAMYFIECYGQIDGAHHKTWVLDQVARILKGTPVVVEIARWDDGNQEYRVSVSEEISEQYSIWRQEMLGEFDEDNGFYEYGYDDGIAP